MTNTSTAPAPKKSNKKLLIIAVIITALSLDYYKFHFVLGKDAENIESAIVVTPATDSMSNEVVSDSSAKADTTGK